jgi:hypothetical protein
MWTPIIQTAGYPIVIDETGELPKDQGGDGCTILSSKWKGTEEHHESCKSLGEL